MKKITFGPYELGARLHAARAGGLGGGVTEVFAGVDTRNGRACAVKRILPAVTEDEDFVRMFEDEARIASQLDHPNVARVVDFGNVAGQYFIAYELVDGVDLRVIFENASLAGEHLPLPFVLGVFTMAARALAHAHGHDVVHRDVSPHNIAVSFDGDVKLIDFGIAKAKGNASRTGAGVIKGKLGYMSPEQVRGGTRDEPVDARTDLFSLGICMWELLTLKRLFSAPNELLVLDMVKRHVPDPPSRHRPDLSQALDRVVLKALAKDRDERYRSARQITRDLDEILESSGTGEVSAAASREAVARTMHRTFSRASRPDNREAGGPVSTGSIMELQETTRMSDDSKSGSDLDIFEGLGKKSSARTSAAPPPPPGSSAHLASAPPAAIPAAADTKKTLMGVAPSAAGVPAAATSSSPSAPPAQTTMVSPQSTPSSPPVPAASPSGAPSAGRVSAPPPLPPSASSASGSMRAAAPSAPPAAPSKPPPPPGRGSLPNLSATLIGPGPSPAPAQSSPSGQIRASQVPPPASTRPVSAAPATTPSGSMPAALPVQPGDLASPPATATAKGRANGGKLDMDWDDDDEATHVFDKESRDNQQAAPPAGPESRRPEHASMDDILSSPPPSRAPAAGTPPPPATLSGAFGALGQPREGSNGSSPSGAPSAQFRSGPPPSQSLRSAPPPPPQSGGGSGPPPSMRPYNPSTSTAPMPPPPPPGQTTTAPMHMPPSARQPSHPPSMPPHHSQPPHPSSPPQQHSQHPHSQPPQQHSQPPMPHMPPVSRNMEATAVVPRQQSSSAGLWVALLLGVVAVVGAGVYFLMPRTGTLVVNVADAKGAAISKIDITVDGKSACTSAPCIVKDVSAGVHEVKVSATGFDPPAARAVTIESRKDSSIDFSLSPAKTAGGTGLKIAGNPLQSGVRLSVDGKEYGPLPQEIHDLTPGEHKVKISGSERYAPVEKTIDVKQDELVDLGNVALKVLKGKATIQLGTPGAKVYLVSGTNRKEVPQFPIAIDFDPSEKWNLEAKMAGMDDYSQPISFDDGQAEKTIVVTLSPKGSTPAATAAAPPVVAHGPTPPPFVAPKAPTAPAEPKEPVAAVTPKEPPTGRAPAAPAAGEAFLNINSRPASTVLLDGRPLGPTPRVKVSVTPGTHTVLFVNAEESLKKSVSITVAAGETKAVSAKLRD